MPQRRIKSIMHGSAEDTRVYHHEHRSKKGRKNIRDIERTARLRAEREERDWHHTKRQMRNFVARYNGDKEFRRKLKYIK